MPNIWRHLRNLFKKRTNNFRHRQWDNQTAAELIRSVNITYTGKKL